MKFIQTLRSFLLKHHPGATLEEEHLPSGNVWIDVRLNGTLFVIEYKPRRGFGVSTIHRPGGLPSLDGYGEGADRHFVRFAEAKEYLERLLHKVDRKNSGGRKPLPPSLKPEDRNEVSRAGRPITRNRSGKVRSGIVGAPASVE